MIVPGFNERLGLILKGKIGDEYVVELAVNEGHWHDAGYVHGGVYLSLLDTAISRAARCFLSEDANRGDAAGEGSRERLYWPTLELKSNFFRPVKEGVITARAKVLNVSRRTCYAEAEIRDESGRLLARASATLLAAGAAPVGSGEMGSG